MKTAADVLNKPFHSNFLKLIFAGSLVGIFTGLVVSLFRNFVWTTHHELGSSAVA